MSDTPDSVAPAKLNGAIDRLVVELQAELRAIAADQMSGERPGHTLQPTAIVNEAYLRLAKQYNLADVSRTRFLAAAARTMERILIDHARAKSAAKRGGDRLQLSLDGLDIAQANQCSEIESLADALERLGAEDERMRQIVVLRYFGGLTVAEVARSLDISVRTVTDDWTFARAWLRRELTAIQ
jgi:RNA polymerase sigma factor (TIGR02999 family)